MDCSKCGSKNEHDAIICISCGAELSKTSDADITMALTPVDVEKELDEINLEKSDGPVLIVQKGPFVGQAFSIAKKVINLGRDPGSDIFLDDITVSRNHATLTVRNDNVLITDSGSLNGTYVNQQIVEAPTLLSTNDEIQIGKFRLGFIA
ncbi:MAG: FHA domain-containing protein [Rubrobacteridae bacterium]|nr:FHA domain-containing protein [Rubrobacteridae bacterium]